VTHALLDRQTVREFSNGRYLFWNITGNVKFVFVNTGAINAVVSGLFFDPATTGYQPSVDQRYLYDGWNLLAEQDYNPVTGSYVPGQRYTWGLDLSGTMQGAGGVGGLLAIHPAPGTSSSSFVPAYDGNGNLTTLIRTTDRTVAAAYEYGPFGEPLRATGPMANANPFRFSTKYCDEETGFLYYGYRYYQPQTGRWLSRDPLGDVSFYQAYSQGMSRSAKRQLRQFHVQAGYDFLKNRPAAHVDVLGLWNPVEGAIVEIIERISNEGVFWGPALCPTKGDETRFIQVYWYNRSPQDTGGIVDNGSTGSWKSPPGFHVPTDPTQPWYPQETPNDIFSDNPKGLFNVHTHFEVCRVCFCGPKKCARSVGPCKTWKRYDEGGLSDHAGAASPSAGWWEAVKRQWPNLMCK
jgi:RHS repeat-associated protein